MKVLDSWSAWFLLHPVNTEFAFLGSSWTNLLGKLICTVAPICTYQVIIMRRCVWCTIITEWTFWPNFVFQILRFHGERLRTNCFFPTLLDSLSGTGAMLCFELVYERFGMFQPCWIFCSVCSEYCLANRVLEFFVMASSETDHQFQYPDKIFLVCRSGMGSAATGPYKVCHGPSSAIFGHHLNPDLMGWWGNLGLCLRHLHQAEDHRIHVYLLHQQGCNW